jgi:hypothetical protein
MAPVAVQEAAVAPAGPAAALLGLEHHHAQPRLPLNKSQRRPEPRVATADDRDVGLDVTFQRRRGIAAEAGAKRLVQPPDPA